MLLSCCISVKGFTLTSSFHQKKQQPHILELLLLPFITSYGRNGSSLGLVLFQLSCASLLNEDPSFGGVSS